MGQAGPALHQTYMISKNASQYVLQNPECVVCLLTFPGMYLLSRLFLFWDRVTWSLRGQ